MTRSATRAGPSQRQLRVGELMRHASPRSCARRAARSRPRRRCRHGDRGAASAGPAACHRLRASRLAARNARGRSSRRSTATAAFLRGWLAPQIDAQIHCPSLRFGLDTRFDEAGADRRAAAPRGRARPGAATPTDSEDDDGAVAQRRADRRLARARQARGHDLDPGGGARQAPVRRRQGRPCRDPRPAGDGCCRSRSARRPRPFPTSWTGEKLYRFTRPLGRGAANRRCAKARSPATSTQRPTAAAIRRRCPHFTGADHAGPAGLFGHQGRRASAPMTWPATGETVELAPRADPDRRARAWSRCPTATMPFSRSSAARAPISAPGPRPRPGARARSAMSRRCGGLAVGPFPEEHAISLETLARVAAISPRRFGAF